jgi:hypothetical protein
VLVYIWLALVVAADIAGATFAIRTKEKPARKIITFLAVATFFVSVCTFLYLGVVAQAASSLPFAQRVDAVVPWIRTGLCLSAAALLMSLFSVRKARICLVIASLGICFLWYGVGMAAV